MSGTTAWLILAAIGIALGGYALFVEPLMLKVRRVDVRYPDLPEGLDGFTVCHLSDTHSVHFGLIERKLVRTLARIDADLCAITGDIGYVPIGVEVLRRACEALNPKHGTFFVPGNGDYRVVRDIAEIVNGLNEFGVRSLMNDSVAVSGDGWRVNVIGVEDPHRGHGDLARALSTVKGDGFNLVLAHSPDVMVDVEDGVADLVLAGHTHGGQVRLPFIGPVWLHCRHSHGLAQGYYAPRELTLRLGRELPGVHLYVSGGVGGSWVKARFMSPPEVVVVTLRRHEHQSPKFQKTSSEVGSP